MNLANFEENYIYYDDVNPTYNNEVRYESKYFPVPIIDGDHFIGLHPKTAGFFQKKFSSFLF